MEEQKKQDLLTVLVAVCNAQSNLERCVKSLMDQTYQNLQIILVDDGSSDRSGEMCDRFALQDARIEVIHKKQEGLFEALNTGIAHACGRYIAFVYGDDYIHHEMYNAMLHAMEVHEANLADCCYYRAWHTMTDEPYRGCGMMPADRIGALKENLFGKHFTADIWNKVFEKKLLNGLSFNQEKVRPDNFLTYKAILRADRLIHLDFPFYYRQQGKYDGMTFKSAEDYETEELDAYMERIEYIREHAPEALKDAELDLVRHMFDRMHDLSVYDTRPVSVVFPVFASHEKLLTKLPDEILEPYCSLSRKKNLKVTCLRKMVRIEPKFTFHIFRLTQKLKTRKQKTYDVYLKDAYELYG